jgi:hypothetical protein
MRQLSLHVSVGGDGHDIHPASENSACEIAVAVNDNAHD